MKVTVKNIKIDGYYFDSKDNPYEYDSNAVPFITLTDIAQQICNEINSTHDKLIIRGIQSGKHKVDKDVLLEAAIKNGQDYENIDETNTMFAAPFEGEKTIQHILEGFHKYKPKSEERPQYPVDIWFIFDSRAYENVKYLHPRHNVLASDRWKRINPVKTGLLEVIVLR
jgi:hypothetical protein